MKLSQNQFALTLLGLLVALSGCAKKKGKEAEEKKGEERKNALERIELSAEAMRGLRLGFAKAEERDLSPSLVVTGEIVPVPDQRADIGSLVGGRVAQVRVNVGDRVRRGAPLVIIDSPEVGKARAELLGTNARLAAARQTFEREKALLESRGTSKREFEQAEAGLRTAEAEVQAARTTLSTLGVSERAAPSLAKSARIVLASPIDGIVVARAVHVGQSVETTQTLIEVVDLDQLWLLGDVYERDMRLVETGQPVQVDVRAYPGEAFGGQVGIVGGTLDEKTRTVKVRVVLPNADHRLRPGMFATARIQGTHAHAPTRMLAIPWDAVQQIDDHATVFVHAAERTFELRRVHTGERAGDLVELLNGVKAGEEVVAEGSFLLKGQLMRSSLGESE